jgi:hypothetical protein
MTKTPKSHRRTGSGGAGKGRAPGNPPKSTRFQKGSSGNPTGRPKGSRNLATLFKEAAKHPVEAKINGKLRKITTVQATIMQLAAGMRRVAIIELLRSFSITLMSSRRGLQLQGQLNTR